MLSMKKNNLNFKKQKIQKNNLQEDYLQEDFRFPRFKLPRFKLPKLIIGGEKPLVNKGGTPFVWPFGTRGKRLNACQGDCDSDGDCIGKLKCFQRSGREKVPGCKKGRSGDVSGYDYCYDSKKDFELTTSGTYDKSMTKADCKEFSDINGHKWYNKSYSHKAETPGCFLWGNKTVYFNKNSGSRGKCNYSRSLKCVKLKGYRKEKVAKEKAAKQKAAKQKAAKQKAAKQKAAKEKAAKKVSKVAKKNNDYELTTSGNPDKTITKDECKRFSDMNGYKWYNKSYSQPKNASACFLYKGKTIYYNTNMSSSGKCNKKHYKCVKKKEYELTTSGNPDKTISKDECKRFSDMNGYKWYNKSYSQPKNASACFLYKGKTIYYNTNMSSSGKCNKKHYKCVKKLSRKLDSQAQADAIKAKEQAAAKKAYEKSVAKQKAAKSKSDAKKLKAAKADKIAAAKLLKEAKKAGKVVKKFDSKKQCAFRAGYTCVEDGNCESGWCHMYKCKNKYGYLQPSPGICGSDKECSGTLACHLTKCKYGKNTREIGQSCTDSYQCKGYTFGTASGNACCKGYCRKKLQDYSGNYWCSHECRGSSDVKRPRKKILGITPTGSCHLSNGSKQKEVKPKLKNGKMCIAHHHCKSGWCHNWKCRKTYGYLQPNPGLCGGDHECTSKNCEGRCIYKRKTRKKGQSCNTILAGNNECKSGQQCDLLKKKCYHWPRHVDEPCGLPTDCKSHNLAVWKSGTSCCGGLCKNKKNTTFGYWCPNMDKTVNIGGTCGQTSHCKKGACCEGKCTNTVKDWFNAQVCPKICKGCATCSAGSCHLLRCDKNVNNGKQCAKNCNCKSGWCHLNKCKAKQGYGYRVCASNNECSSGNCNWGKCVYGKKSRGRGQSCNAHSECKTNSSHGCESSNSKCYHWPRRSGERCKIDTDCKGGTVLGSGYACCGHYCKNKVKQWTGIYTCPPKQPEPIPPIRIPPIPPIPPIRIPPIRWPRVRFPRIPAIRGF
jgi:hypothetical protein